MRDKKTKFTIATIILSLLIIIVCGEIITRLFGATTVYKFDSVLGWRPKRNFSEQIPVIDQSGKKYFATFSTNNLGFREFGNLKSNKPRIMFVGDSFTGEPYTSDDDAYFGIVKKSLPVEVFAIGAGGYGTLQEMILVKELARKINPDIFILQYCDNDLINNSFFLENPSFVRNQKNLRPYWMKGKIIYRLSPDSLYITLYKNFRLFRSLDSLLTNLQYWLYGGYYPPPYQAYDGTIQAKTLKQQLEINAQKEMSISTTEFLLSKMKQYLPVDTKLVTFNTRTTDQEELEIWKTLAAKTGFTAYPSVAQRVEEEEKKGKIVRIHDGGHWNRLGNKIVGEQLVEIIKRDFSELIKDQD